MTRSIRPVTALAILAMLLLGACRQGTDPERLAVGDCFDVPTATDQIGSIMKRACTEPHGGEVFHLFEATTPDDAYPSDTDWEQLIYPICDPVFESYTGTFVGDRLDIGYVYFVPTPDRWAAGDRKVTCFITALDGSQLTRAHRAP